jgi:hypothetical protein
MRRSLVCCPEWSNGGIRAVSCSALVLGGMAGLTRGSLGAVVLFGYWRDGPSISVGLRVGARCGGAQHLGILGVVVLGPE